MRHFEKIVFCQFLGGGEEKKEYYLKNIYLRFIEKYISIRFKESYICKIYWKLCSGYSMIENMYKFGY